MSDNIANFIILLLFIILLIPTFIQSKYGVRALAGWIKIKFWELSLFCFVGEFVLGIAMAVVIAFVSSKFTSDNNPRCGFGLAGIAVFSIPIAFLNLIIALFQKTVLK